MRLRLPSRLGWVLVRAEPVGQSPIVDDTTNSTSAAELPLATTVIGPFIDFDRGVVEARPALVASWQCSIADIYATAINNLRSIVRPTFHPFDVQGCRISMVEAGYWTTGLAYDFNNLLAVHDGPALPDTIDSQAIHTLLIGADNIIWCLDHSARLDLPHRCAINEIAASLS